MTIHVAPEQAVRIACRQISAEDAAAVVDLLAAGFEVRPKAYWAAAFATLRDRVVPDGCPRFGYCLTADGVIVGVILLIYSAPPGGGARRCNVSSWYVLPRFRVYASSLVNIALRNKTSTFINCSSVASTRQTIGMQGFSCYAQGQYIAFAAAGPIDRGVQIRRIAKGDADGGDDDLDLLATHADYGCVSLLCTLDGRSHPFVFLRRRVPRFHVPCAQLIYCEGIEAFVRLQGPLGRYLIARGMPFVMIDANAPIPGLTGHYFAGRGPKYFSGEAPPRLGDLAYTELCLFGP